MGKSNIEWTDMVWNPVTGCTKVSPGCQNCYAERMAMRFTGHFNVTCHPDRLNQPLHWKKPRRIFVCSMGDLFHEDVPDNFIWQIFILIRQMIQHQFLILTKRPERMHDFLRDHRPGRWTDPYPNLWLGVTAENQVEADKRIPILLQIPAAKRFVSIEPMLGEIDFRDYLISCKDCGNDGSNAYIVSYDHQLCGRACKVGSDLANGLDWVIVGAESGAGRRMMDVTWALDIVGQCKEAGVPVFVKQIHCSYKPGDEKKFFVSKNMNIWPEDLRVREFPHE